MYLSQVTNILHHYLVLQPFLLGKVIRDSLKR